MIKLGTCALGEKASIRFLSDGHSFVIQEVCDLAGDNTVLYLTRKQAQRVHAQLGAAIDSIPEAKKKARKK
jgi:hypothetical protein